MTSQISKLGNHRNGKRIWIEGSRLINSGFVRGRHYDVDYGTRYADPVIENDATQVLVLHAIPTGSRTVSGKGNHPIIDISGKKLGEYFSGCESVQVIYNNRLITIVGIPTPSSNALSKASAIFSKILDRQRSI